MTSSAPAIAPRSPRWTWQQLGIGALVAILLVPTSILVGPEVLVVAAIVGIIAWLAARPARGLAIFCWLLPFHVLAMAVLYGGLGISAGIVRTIAAWKEALLAACVIAAIVHAVRTRFGSNEPRLTVTWIDGAILGLLIITTCHLFAAGPWLGSELTLVGKAYAFRDIAFFLLLYFVGRATGPDVADHDATLSRLFTIGVITAVFAVVEYIFVPPAILAAIGTNRYFSEFLNAGVFTANNAFGLPDNLFDVIGGRLVRRAGSTYLVSTAFATAQVVSIAAASVLVFRRDRRPGLLRTLGYLVIWVGLLLSITRMSIVAALIEALLIALWYRRRGVAFSVVALMAIAGIAAVAFLPGFGTFLWDTVTFRTASSGTHVTAWAGGIDAVTSYPFGAGLGTTDETAIRFGTGVPLTGDNLYFKYAVELGIPALLIHIAALLGIAHAGWLVARRGVTSARQRLGLAIFALTIAMFVNAMTEALYNSNFLAYVYFWLAGSVVTVSRGLAKDHRARQPSGATPAVARG